MSLLSWFPDMLGLVTSLGPIVHVGAVVSGIGLPAFLANKTAKLVAILVGILVVLAIIGGLYVALQHKETELAEERQASAEASAAVANASALEANRIATANAAAMAALDARHQAELAAITAKLARARADAAIAAATIKEIAREPTAKDPLPRAFEPLLRRVQ